MHTLHKIVIGDSRNMESIKDFSIHLVVTSPPYWQLKDYGNDNQIGFDDSYQDYINNLSLVWQECGRVLKNGCRLCINIGDQFARSVYYGRYKVIPIRTEIIKFCETIGFDYMGAIIWQKVTTTNTTGGGTVMGSYLYPRNGILKIDYEFILIFKKTGKPEKIDKEKKLRSKLTPEEWHSYFSGHWKFPGEKQKRHLAMFPLELPTRLIKMFTFIGETVLDPFLGNGTTTLSAKKLTRNSIGFEINEQFLPVIKQRLGINNPGFFENSEFVVKKQKLSDFDYKSKFKNLPYIFTDFVKIDKQIDPGENHFGSKINKNSKQDSIYHAVKKIISPNELELDNGLTIKLLGVKINHNKKKEAVEFLRTKTKSQKVFLKFDQKKYDSNNIIIGYLYLKNKTFINAHLIRAGLAYADIQIKHKYSQKFIKYQKD